MAKDEDYHDYFEKEELLGWREEKVAELWDDDDMIYFDLTDEEKADAIKEELNGN